MYITSAGIGVAVELQSTQEEDDTRIFLHLIDSDKRCALQGEGRAIIKTPDTDVVVLAIHFFPQLSSIKEVWIETGNPTKTLDRRRYLPIHDMCKSIGSILCRILPATCALTGCDSISSFHGIGKRSVLKNVSTDDGKDHEDLAVLGCNSLEESIQAARKLVIDLYSTGKKTKKKT